MAYVTLDLNHLGTAKICDFSLVDFMLFVVVSSLFLGVLSMVLTNFCLKKLMSQEEKQTEKLDTQEEEESDVSVEIDEDKLLPPDNVPFSLGVANSSGKMDVFIERNTKFPVKVSKTFCVGQTKEKFSIYEGERLLASGNKLLGNFSLDVGRLPNALTTTGNAEAEIMVTFVINKDGALRVTAEEKSSGKKNWITVTGYKHRMRLFKHEVERMVAEAEEHRSEDEEEMENIAAENALRAYCLKIKENLLKNEKISAQDKRNGLEKSKRIFKWLKSTLLEGIPKELFERRLAELKDFHSQITSSFSDDDEEEENELKKEEENIEKILFLENAEIITVAKAPFFEQSF